MMMMHAPTHTTVADPIDEGAIRGVVERSARADCRPYTWDDLEVRLPGSPAYARFAVDVDVWDIEGAPGQYVRRWRYIGGLPTVQRGDRWYPTRLGDPYLPAITAEVVHRVEALPWPAWAVV